MPGTTVSSTVISALPWDSPCASGHGRGSHLARGSTSSLLYLRSSVGRSTDKLLPDHWCLARLRSNGTTPREPRRHPGERPAHGPAIPGGALQGWEGAASPHLAKLPWPVAPFA